MKIKTLLFAALSAFLFALSCKELLPEDNPGGFYGRLHISFADNSVFRSSMGQDTDSYTLEITDSQGNPVYKGLFCASPEVLSLKSGVYTVSVKSQDFYEPLYDSPQYGDTQIVSLPEGQDVNVVLSCRQINAGLRLDIDSGFRSEYPHAEFYLKSLEGGLMYTYAEKRTAYFLPGQVSVMLSENGVQTTLCSRRLYEQQVLTLGLHWAGNGTSENPSRNLEIKLDTTRVWVEDECLFGGAAGTDPENAYCISDARSRIGDRAVWVHGYIVGQAMTSTTCNFTPPFTKNSNILIASRTSVTDRSSCICLELSKGDIRDLVNLCDNPGNLGRHLYVKGDITDAYYGITGIKNITDYELR